MEDIKVTIHIYSKYVFNYDTDWDVTNSSFRSCWALSIECNRWTFLLGILNDAVLGRSKEMVNQMFSCRS